MSSVCFLDNDIIHKLLALELFDDAIDVLQISRSQLQVLPTAKYWFQGQKKKARQYSEAIWDAGIELVSECQVIYVERDEGWLAEVEYLSQFNNQIHQGERDLILATRSQPDFLLMTGDKVCMQALPKLSEEIFQRLMGRVVCLEQVVLILIRRLGFGVVQKRVLLNVDCDKALRACFGSGDRATEDNVVLDLLGYVDDLQKFAPGLLVDVEKFR